MHSDTYVNTTNLASFLSSYDSIRPYYFGSDVQIFDKSNKTPFNCDGVKYPLCSSNQPINVKYATFSRGVILSRGLLELLITRIYTNVPFFGKEIKYTRSYCYSVSLNDARLGGCLYYELGIQLTIEARLGRFLAPTCNAIDKDKYHSEMTLRHATYGKNCKENLIISERWKKTLSSIVIGITSYHDDRVRTKNLVESIVCLYSTNALANS